MTPGLRQALLIVSMPRAIIAGRLTLDLLIAFAVQLGHCAVFFFQKCEAALQRVGDLQLVVVEVVLAIRFLIHQRRLHLLNGVNESLSLTRHLIFLAAEVNISGSRWCDGLTHRPA